jgi:hypothetical protein
VTICQFLYRVKSKLSNQPLMPRCFAAVDFWSYHIATVPSVRNAGGRESRASQVEPLRFDSLVLRRAAQTVFTTVRCS